jgi:hypothetical protein
MPYADFTLESVEKALGLTIQPGDLFPGVTPLAVPDWLQEILARGRSLAAMVSEKARSEFVVTPILLAVKEFAVGDLAIFSGQRLDVEPARGLTGECDYILARTTPLPRLRAPLITVLEAKKGDIELGLGQCVAQMVGAQLFNERSDSTIDTIFGCVTTGTIWQFLRLQQTTVVMDRTQLFLDNLGGILAALRAIVGPRPVSS